MPCHYDVFLDGNVAGVAHVKRKGLYYFFNCTCKLESKEIHRILLLCKKKEIDLGICVPNGEYFSLNKQIPVNKVQGEEFRFLVKKNSGVDSGIFYRVETEMPFAHISRLNQACFKKINGVPGIWIR